MKNVLALTPAFAVMALTAARERRGAEECENVKVSNSQQPIPNVYLNGEAVKGVKISHEDIMRGGTLVFGKDVVK